MAIRLSRVTSAPSTYVVTTDELLRPSINSVELFQTPNRAALLALPHTLPGMWEKAWDILAPDTPSHHPHVHTVPYDDTRGLALSSWHHGSVYQTVVSGRPEAILPYVEMTDNEREHYLLECTRQNTRGREVLGIATITTTRPIESITALKSHHDLTLVGSLAAERAIHPARLTRLRSLQQKGTRIIIVSREHPGFIQALNSHYALLDNEAYIDAAELPSQLSEEQIAGLCNASGVGHCTAVPLKEYLAKASTTLSVDAQALLQ